MKTNKQFLSCIGLFLVILYFLPATIEAQVKNKAVTTSRTSVTNAKTVVTKLRGSQYTERIINFDEFQTPYSIRCDVRSVITDNMMMSIIEKGKETEKLFGLEPATLLREIHFISDKEKSFFTNEKPTYVFVTTVNQKKTEYYENQTDYDTWVLMEKTEHVRHEICHLIDYNLKFSQDTAVVRFMKKIARSGVQKDLFTLVYLRLPPQTIFDWEIMQKYVKSHDLYGSISKRSGTEVVFEASELFAEAITTLDSPYWEQVIAKERNKPKTLIAYKEMLEVFKVAIERCLSKSEYKQKDIPVVLLIQKRIDQINKI